MPSASNAATFSCSVATKLCASMSVEEFDDGYPRLSPQPA